MLKVRLQCSPPNTFNNALDCLAKTLRNESVFALYKGGLAPALSWSATDAILMSSLHKYRLWILNNKIGFLTEHIPNNDNIRLSLSGHALAGAGAGWTK